MAASINIADVKTQLNNAWDKLGPYTQQAYAEILPNYYLISPSEETLLLHAMVYGTPNIASQILEGATEKFNIFLKPYGEEKNYLYYAII